MILPTTKDLYKV